MPLLIGVGILAAACGGGKAPASGVASLGKTTTTTGSASDPTGSSNSSGPNYQDSLKFTQCMRSHGVPNFPDPQPSGGFLIQGGSGPNGSTGLDPNSSQFKAASKACRSLLPNGGQPSAAQKQQMLSRLLKFSQCMRSHGVPNFPDPTTSGNAVGLHISGKPGSGIDPNSPQFEAANKACASLSPGGKGLPKPGSGSGNGTKALLPS